MLRQGWRRGGEGWLAVSRGTAAEARRDSLTFRRRPHRAFMRRSEMKELEAPATSFEDMLRQMKVPAPLSPAARSTLHML